MTRRRLQGLGAVAAVLAAVAFLVLRGGGEPEGQVVVAQFEQVRGLVVGAPVRAGGVPVGTVEEIRVGSGDVPEVTMRLEPDYVVRTGATADLGMLSQAGQLNRYIELTSGSGRALGEGTVLTLGQTDQPVELDDAFNTLTPRVRKDVERITTALDAGLDGRGDDVSATLATSDRALRHTGALIADVVADAPALRRLVRESQTLVSELATQPAELQGAADEAAATLAVTAGRQRELADSIEALAPGLRGARQSLHAFADGIPDIRRASREAAPAARELRTTAPVARELLGVAPEALGGAAQLLRSAPVRLTAIRPLLRDLLPVARRLPPVLEKFGPVLDEMRSRAPDLFGFLPLLNDAASSYDANGHALRILPVFEQPGENPVTQPDETTPGALPAPFDRTPGATGGEPWRDYRKSFVGSKPWDPDASKGRTP